MNMNMNIITDHKMKYFINCITDDLKTCNYGGLMMV